MENQDASMITSENKVSWPAFHSQMRWNKKQGINMSPTIVLQCCTLWSNDKPLYEDGTKGSVTLEWKPDTNYGNGPTTLCHCQKTSVGITLYIWWGEVCDNVWWVAYWDGGLQNAWWHSRRMGWTTALSEARVASLGTANSFLKASHITKTRHAHQVSAASLFIL